MTAKQPKLLLILLALAGLILFALTRSVTAEPVHTGTQWITAAAQEIPGQRLIFAETIPGQTESILWLASAPDLAQRAEIARVTHAPGYPPRGAVSPSGQQIAIFNLPPSEGPATARTGGNEIWLAGLDGSAPQRLASQAGFLGHWSPDGRWLTYGRMIPLDTPTSPHISYRTEIYRLSITGESSLLLSNDQDYALYPLGWTPDSAGYLVALVDLAGLWRVEARDPATGSLLQTWALPGYQLPRRFSLSPDALSLLVEDQQDGQAVLSIFDLSGQRVQAQSILSAAPLDEQQPVSPAAALWLPAGGSVWLYRQPSPGLSAAGQALSLDADPQGEPALLLPPESDTLLLPESLSPDALYRLWRLYPRNYTSVYLQQGDETALQHIQPSQPGNWITFLGWSALKSQASGE